MPAKPSGRFDHCTGAMAGRFPEQVAGWAALATATANTEDRATAEPAFGEWRKRSPGDPHARSNYGIFLHRAGDSLGARAVLETTVRDFPGHGYGWINYSVVLEALGETVAAAEARLKAEGLMTPEERETVIR